MQVLWTHAEIFAREEGAIERATTRSSVQLLNLIAENALRPSLPPTSFLAPIVDGCTAPQHERLAAHEVAAALEDPALRDKAMFEPPGAAAYDERRTSAFDDAMADEEVAADETSVSVSVAVRASAAAVPRCSRWTGQARGSAACGSAARFSTACASAAAEGSAGRPASPPRPPMPTVLSRLASLGSSKRLFEGSLSRGKSLKRVDGRLDSPSRPKTPAAGAKEKSAKWSNSWSDFVPALGGGRGSQVDQRSVAVQQPAAAETSVQAELPPTVSEGSAEHRDESDEGNDDDDSRRV